MCDLLGFYLIGAGPTSSRLGCLALLGKVKLGAYEYASKK